MKILKIHINKLKNELGSYNKQILDKKEIIVLNKTDLLDEDGNKRRL